MITKYMLNDSTQKQESSRNRLLLAVCLAVLFILTGLQTEKVQAQENEQNYKYPVDLYQAMEWRTCYRCIRCNWGF